MIELLFSSKIFFHFKFLLFIKMNCVSSNCILITQADLIDGNNCCELWRFQCVEKKEKWKILISDGMRYVNYYLRLIVVKAIIYEIWHATTVIKGKMHVFNAMA